MITLLTLIWNNWKLVCILLAVAAVYILGLVTGIDHVKVQWDRADQYRAEAMQKERDKIEKADHDRDVAYENQRQADEATISHLQQLWETANAKNHFPDTCRLDARRVRLINLALSDTSRSR